MVGTGSGRSHRLLPHTADIGISASAPNPEAVLEEAAVALAEVQAEGVDRSPLPRGGPELVELTGRDKTALAFAWLNELVGLGEVHGGVALRTRVDELQLQAGAASLCARAWFASYGDGIQPRHHVKSVSFHRLRVRRRGGRWTLTAYLDL